MLETAGSVSWVRADRWWRTRLSRLVTGLLNTRGDISTEAGLLAMAREVGQRRASVASQGLDEAIQLVSESMLCLMIMDEDAYRAGREIWDLGAS